MAVTIIASRATDIDAEVVARQNADAAKLDVAEKAAINGVATLGADGLLLVGQRPAGAGAGTITSVNTQTGPSVVLAASDVGAAPVDDARFGNLTGEAADRAAADANHLSSFDPHGDRAMAALLGAGRFYPNAISAVSGVANNSADSLAAGIKDSTDVTGSGAATLNQMVATVLYAAEALVLRDWTVNVTAGAGSSLYRMAVQVCNNQANPFRWTAATGWATLLTQLGTVDCSTPGAKVITTAIVIPAGTWFAVIGGFQGALATATIGDARLGLSSVFGAMASPASTSRAGIGLAQNGVTGALGSFTPAALSPIGNGICFRRSL